MEEKYLKRLWLVAAEGCLGIPVFIAGMKTASAFLKPICGNNGKITQFGIKLISMYIGRKCSSKILKAVTDMERNLIEFYDAYDIDTTKLRKIMFR